MKWTAFITALATYVALANSLAPRQGPSKAHYRLRVSAPGNPDLEGKYLGLSDNTVGIYSGGGSDTAVLLTASTGSDLGVFELHTFPVGIVDHALGLVGTDGLLDFVDVTNPYAARFSTGTAYRWRAFSMGAVDQATGAPSADSHAVSYGNQTTEDKWAAWPGKRDGEWNVKWKDDSSFSIQIYQPIDVVYEKVDA